LNDDRQAVGETVLSLLRSIAPEHDPATIDWKCPLRRQVDLDSMDWLNFLVALSARFGVDVPESEYGRLVTLADVIDYLMTRRTE
jgi:acyl carrier protein